LQKHEVHRVLAISILELLERFVLHSKGRIGYR
jgi:hypothetical protein